MDPASEPEIAESVTIKDESVDEPVGEPVEDSVENPEVGMEAATEADENDNEDGLFDPTMLQLARPGIDYPRSRLFRRASCCAAGFHGPLAGASQLAREAHHRRRNARGELSQEATITTICGPPLTRLSPVLAVTPPVAPGGPLTRNAWDSLPPIAVRLDEWVRVST
ncbi:hypothetical protein BJY04DRAFT_219818 [Aspergillus karnatakaensis]|uniref:uncharacterized protein n=1 Tax=Aspergillus karnatakaensis TaxID=1810916 RepID=UPI003CCD0FA4